MPNFIWGGLFDTGFNQKKAHGMLSDPKSPREDQLMTSKKNEDVLDCDDFAVTARGQEIVIAPTKQGIFPDNLRIEVTVRIEGVCQTASECKMVNGVLVCLTIKRPH